MTAPENIPVQDATVHVITADPLAPYHPYIVGSFFLSLVLLLGLIFFFRQKSWVVKLENTKHINTILDVWVALILILLTISSTAYSPLWDFPDLPIGKILAWYAFYPLCTYIGAMVILFHAWISLSQVLNISTYEKIGYGTIIAILSNYLIFRFCIGNFPSITTIIFAVAFGLILVGLKL
jgi:hypothetical protein